MTKEQALEQARNFQPKGPCTTVMTPAVHVETGARYTFTSGCLPEGWVAERNYNADNTTTNSSVSTGWVEHATVDVNNQYDYRLVIKNTGDVDLKSTEVRDAAPSGVTFIDADKGQITNNVWTYTIPELKVGQSTTVVIKAKVTEYVAGTLTNTACVDATEVPGDKDDCDDATVDVEKPPVTPPAPQPEKVKVCDLDDKSIVWVTEDQLEDNPERYTTDLSKCEEAPEAPEVPTELPQTGLGLALNGLAGIGTLTAASYYYVSSRRF